MLEVVVSTRTEQLKESLLATQPEICPERLLLLTAAYQETEGQPLILRRAEALARVLRNMSIYIRPGELIVGNQARCPRAAPLFPENASTWIEKEMDDLGTRPQDAFLVREEDKLTLREVLPYWRGKTHYDYVKALTRQALPVEARAAFNFEHFTLNQALCNFGRATGGDGHIILDFTWLLRVGLRALVAEARQKMAALDRSRPENLEKLLFYQAVTTSLEGAIAFAERFAELAVQMAETEADPDRRAELFAIAETCRRVPAHPARTFREAVQSVWFLHLLIQIESNGHSISLGRFDQYLYPYYRTDLAAGILTREQALELVECFWIKCSEVNKVREWAHTHYMSGCPLFQTLTLGGQTRDGAEAVNDLTYVCLEATGNMKLHQPTVIVRLYDGSPDALLQEASRAVLRHGGGMPGFFNDEVGIPMLLRLGVSLEDARDWAVMGCAEPQVGGRFNTGTGGTSHLNLLKLLELALHGGVNPSNGTRLCPTEGDLASFRSFDELMAAYQRQVQYYVAFMPLLDNVTSAAFAALTPTPLLSGLLEHRLAAGRDVSSGGDPGYNLMPAFGLGVTNVANAMAAVRELVFEEKRLSGAELLEALDADFTGSRGEQIRQMLLNWAPKYGNDDDSVDQIARQVLNEFVAEIERYTPARGGHYAPTTQSLTVNVPYGKNVGATPDGRHAGEPLADNSSPSAGTDTHGPTATVKSVAKLDHVVVSNGTILNLKFHPTALHGEGRLWKFGNLIRSFFDLKGFQVQFNVLSPEKLRDAQRHPERYRNLIVKVAGYSAYFTSLDKELQEQLIARTTYDAA
jgi:formate C-acetyltransferase